MGIGFYDLDLNEQMAVGFLEDYHGFEFKKALEIIVEYREVLNYLKFGIEENIELILQAKSNGATGKIWVNSIKKTLVMLTNLSGNSQGLDKAKKINKKIKKEKVDFIDLDYFEQGIVETLMIAYHHKLNEALEMLNKYLLEFYEIDNYYISEEEWSMYLKYAFENNISLSISIKEYERAI